VVPHHISTLYSPCTELHKSTSRECVYVSNMILPAKIGLKPTLPRKVWAPQKMGFHLQEITSRPLVRQIWRFVVSVLVDNAQANVLTGYIIGVAFISLILFYPENLVGQIWAPGRLENTREYPEKVGKRGW
jgi:hypothetical protein